MTNKIKKIGDISLGTELNVVESQELKASVENDLKQEDPDEATASRIIYGEAKIKFNTKGL